jgi:hypothetical protein
MTDKDFFVKLINIVRRQLERQRSFSKAVQPYFSNTGLVFDLTETDKLIDVLSEAWDDKNVWIKWWIYETNFGRRDDMAIVTIPNDSFVKIDTAEKLYDFITKECECSETH